MRQMILKEPVHCELRDTFTVQWLWLWQMLHLLIHHSDVLLHHTNTHVSDLAIKTCYSHLNAFLHYFLFLRKESMLTRITILCVCACVCQQRRGRVIWTLYWLTDIHEIQYKCQRRWWHHWIGLPSTLISISMVNDGSCEVEPLLDLWKIQPS
jgi:hypothetical protein